MDTVRFTTRPDGYGCNKPGDMSGEYVPADVARENRIECHCVGTENWQSPRLLRWATYSPVA